jgi:hypothetical protein
VPVDVQLDADGIAQLADVRIKTLVLDCVRGLLAAVRLGAGILRGAKGVRVPAIFPVAVDVGAEAGLAGRRRRAGLAPETVFFLRVDEAVWVDNGEDVEVVGI